MLPASYRLSFALCLACCLIGGIAPASASSFGAFLERHCYDCHADGMDKGGLDFFELERDLDDPSVFATWQKVFDRVQKGEMPPEKKPQPTAEEKLALLKPLGSSLMTAHEKKKGTVLRRLNRSEYANTMNDLFGTHLDLANMLPEDGRSHEFDNVGKALGISMAHLQQYLEAARLVYDEVAAQPIDFWEPKFVEGTFSEQEAKRFIGKDWKRLKDGAIVRFKGGGYPSGMLRGVGFKEPGRYRVKVTGYAYQSDKPVVALIGGTSFRRGSDKPVFGFGSFPPDKPTTVELEITVEDEYMLLLEPQEIAFPRSRPKNINEYDGPGFALLNASVEGPLISERTRNGQKVLFDGIARTSWDREPWKGPPVTFDETNGLPEARQGLKRIAEEAWRRPVEDAEIQRYLQLFEEEVASGSEFDQAYRTAVTALFVSPHFLYYQEDPGPLQDWAVANRLSYFLNRTAPDEELRALAAEAALTGNANILREQAERLMASPDFDRFLKDFTDAWLNLREMDFTAPDSTLFPEFDLYLRHSMPAESVAFLRELLDENLPARNIVKSDFAMLNGRLADHYDLPPVNGPKIRRVSLPADSVRGGFLSQGSVLKVSANGTNTSPVLRGVWVLERILADPPSPPPPGIPGVEPDIRGAETLRELLDLHRSSESCQACHQKIDPPGFALEYFNPIGGYRDYFRSLGSTMEKVDAEVRGRSVRYRKGPDVDGSGQLPTGEPFDNYTEFRDLLAANDTQLARAFVNKILTFATGREMGFSDRPIIDEIVQSAADRDYPCRELLLRAVTSEIFLSK